jgi:hypothetical protein
MLPFAALAAPAGQDAGAEGPSGAPSGGTWWYYSGTKVGATWTNGDATASTQVYWKDISGGCPSVLPDDAEFIETVSPGVVEVETEKTVGCSLFIRHVKNGQYSAWHQITSGPTTCSTCPV